VKPGRLILNIIRGSFKVCAVRHRDMGRNEKLSSRYAILTGANVISEERGRNLECSRAALARSHRQDMMGEKTLSSKEKEPESTR
jgi:chaperonin GroEL (HSP60 family)